MVGGPAHGPRVDVVQLAAFARARALVTLAILKELLLAMPHRRRDGAVVPRRDERQPPQTGGDGDNVDDGPWLRLIQLLRSALARLPPSGGGVPAADQKLKFTLSFAFVCMINERISAGRQARQIHDPLTGAMLVLQIASTLKISLNHSLCLMVRAWLKSLRNVN